MISDTTSYFLTSGNFLELAESTVKNIRISAISITVRVLPDGLEWPVARDGSGGGGVAGQDQRGGGGEGCAVARALAPPVCCAVDHGVAGGLSVVGVREILNPGHHGRLAEAVAGSTAWVVLDIEHARESDSVTRPPTSVGEEVGGLSDARAGIRVGKVVAATDEASVRSPNVVVGETGIDVIRAFCGL